LQINDGLFWASDHGTASDEQGEAAPGAACSNCLVAIERERRELKERIAALAAQLKRDER
jgi:hypothetical protein